MSLFRSEEHLERWLRANGHALGAVVPLGTVWELSRAWYVDPRDADWRPRTLSESQAILTAAGLTGDFWALGDN